MGSNSEQRVLDIQVNYQKAIEGIGKYRTEIDSLKAKEAEYKKALKEGAISQQEYNEKMADSRIKTQQYAEAIKVMEKEIQNNIKAEKQREGSLVSLRAQLSNLTRQYDEMSEAERESASGQDLEIHINAITDKIKDAEEKTQRFYRNVGKYQEAFEKALEPLKNQLDDLRETYMAMSEEERKGAEGDEMREHMRSIEEQLRSTAEAGGNFQNQLLHLVGIQGGLLGNISNMASGMGSLSNAFMAGKAAVMAFGKQMLTLLLNPVVLAIAAVVAVLILLKSGFDKVNETIKGSEELNYKYQKSMALNSVMSDGLTKINEKLAETYIKLVGGMSKGIATFMDWLGLTKGAKDIMEEYIQLEEDKYQLSVRTRKANEEAAENDLKISVLKNKVAQKDKYNHKERLSFLDEAIKLETDNAKKREALAAENLRILEEEGKRTMNSAEFEEKLSQARINLTRATIDLNNKTKEMNAQRVEAINAEKMEEKAKADAKKSAAKEAADAAKEQRDKEREAIRQAEDSLLSLVKDEAEKRRKEISISYKREIENLKNKLKEETNLTAKAKDAIRETIKAKEKQLQVDLAKLSDEQLQKEIEQRQKLIELQLSSIKSGSEQEHQLKIQQLLSQRDMELTNTELTEQMKLAIKAKYDKQMDDLSTQRNADSLKKQQEEVKLRFDTEIAQAYGNEEAILQIKVEQKRAELETLQQMEGESLEAFNYRKIELNNSFLDAKQELANKEVEIEQVKYQAAADITGALSTLADAASEHSRGLAMASKVLALAEIAINTGKAIAAGVAQAQSVPFPGNIIAVATTIATVMANIATATKTVKSAKFATGGRVTGPGSGTSDSIPAQLSNGESVITARATDMFAPILSSFNMMGGGVPINVTATSNQTMGEDMLARAVAKGVQMMPRPVVSVEEINSVSNRVNVLENLGSL